MHRLVKISLFVFLALGIMLLVLWLIRSNQTKTTSKISTENEITTVIETTAPEEKVDFSKVTLSEFFPHKIGFYWYYEGPLDSELIMVIESVIKTDQQETFNLKAINEDLTGEQKLKDMIFYPKIVIMQDQIVKDGVIILKMPLVVGNSWTTEYFFGTNQGRTTKSDKPAQVRITAIKGRTIETETEILNLNEYADKKYIEYTTLEIGQGITYQWHNVPYASVDEFKVGFTLHTTRETPIDQIKWYLPPY